MHSWALLLCLVVSISPSIAVFEDDAYHVDYHYPLLGIPQQQTAFFQQPYTGSKASLIYTISEKNVLGAVNPKDGAIVWRHQLQSHNPHKALLRAGEDQDSVISALGGELTAWSASDGKSIWSKNYPTGTLQDMEILELPSSSSESTTKDVLVLLNDTIPVVQRVDGQTGKVKWSFEDNSGDVAYQISASTTDIYLISLHSTLLGSIKIKVSTLDPITGRKSDQYILSSDTELSSTDLILFVGANSASPLLVWTDKAYKVLKVNILGSKSIASLKIDNTGEEEIKRMIVHAPHRTNSVPHFLVHYETSKSHWAVVYHADLKANSVKEAYALPKLGGPGSFATSTTDANVYFTRLTSEQLIVVSSMSHGILGRWPVKGLGLASANSYPIHGISEVAVRSGTAQAVRSAVLFSSGNWVLIRNGELSWTRPEALASTVSAVFVDLPEEASLAHELEVEVHQNVLAAYIHRVRRHLDDLYHFPAWLQDLPKRVLASFIGVPSEDLTSELKKDSFGFRKVVVLATENGRLAGIDTARGGRLIWNMDYSGFVPSISLKSVSLEALAAGIVKINSPELEQSVYIEATTGKVVEQPLLQSATLLARADESFKGTKISYQLVDGIIKGFVASEEPAGQAWSFVPPPAERIVTFTGRPAFDPVASLGRVLGDRKVLYKYLNPNLVLVTTVSDKLNYASLYLLDAVSGNVLYSATHENVDISRPIHSAVSENWVAYSYTTGNSTDSPSRGYQLVIAELFESSVPNDRGPLGSNTNFSAIEPLATDGRIAKPHVKSQSYLIPEEITYMAVTQTRQGITSRELLVSLQHSSAIVGIPRAVINPRRPVGRDPTAQELSEGLSRYVPSLEFDPKWTLNHKRELLGIEKIFTTPALLESTSLVFAYGHDIFGTRVSPSFSFDVLGKGFNKLQMVGTVLALTATVLFVAPLVRRKQINTQWQSL